jgi:pimeloyl-ACP methyl ester carboxylesterase
MMTIFWIIVALVALVLLLERGIDKMYAYESPPHSETPKKYGISFEEWRIPARDGGELYAWFIPALPDAPTLILVHGWSRNAQRMLPYIRKLHRQGYNLLAFDARNHGSSTPTRHPPTVGTFTEDVLAALDELARRKGSFSRGVGLVGLSIGGGASLAAAGRDERIQAVVTVGALSHPITVMRRQFEKKNVPQVVGSFLFGFLRIRYGLDFNEIAPVNLLPRSEAKVLLIHGEQDQTIALSQAKELFAARPENTELWIVPNKGHSDCHFHPEFWERVLAFFAENLPPKREF